MIVYCGYALYSFILKRVTEEIFGTNQLLTHYLSQFQLDLHLLLLHTLKKIKKKIGQVRGGKCPLSTPPDSASEYGHLLSEAKEMADQMDVVEF